MYKCIICLWKRFFAPTVVLLLCIVLLMPVKSIQTIIRVAVCPNLPPYQFTEEDQLCGLHIDVMDQIAELNGYSVEYVVAETTDRCLELLEQRKVDVVLGVVLKESSPYVNQMTEELSQSTVCLLTHQDNIQNVQDKVLRKTMITAFERGTINYSFMSNAGLMTYMMEKNQICALQAQLEGRADATVGVKASLLYQLKQLNMMDDYVIANSNLAPIAYTAVVSAGDQHLLDELNYGIAYLRASGQYGNIYDQWIVEENDIHYLKQSQDLIARYMKYFSAVLLFTSIIIFAFVCMNRTLKKKVKEKTKELQQTNDDLEQRVLQTQRDSELRSLILENSPNAIIMADRQGKVMLINQRAFQMMRLSQTAMGQCLMSVPLLARFLEGKWDILLDGTPVVDGTVQILENDSCSFYRCAALPVYEDNQVSSVLITIDDVTLEKQEQEILLEKEKIRVLNQLVAGISHEIRNPLMSIKIYTQLIAERKGSSEFWESYMRVVPMELDRINRLVEELLAYAKPVRGKSECVSVREIVQSCFYLLHRTKGCAEYSMNIDVPEDLFLNINPNRFKQILINIILNGLESMETERMHNKLEKRQSIDIGAWRGADGIYICITDYGVGMTDEEIKHATEPFYTTKPRGTGMGLAVTRQFVEENGGRLLIQSKKHQYTRVILFFKGRREE